MKTRQRIVPLASPVRRPAPSFYRPASALIYRLPRLPWLERARPTAGHDDFPAFAFRLRGGCCCDGQTPAALGECGSVEGSGPTAARTDPLCDWFRVRALASRMCLLARPARAQAHWAVPAWALLRLELGLLFRVRQVADILGKPPLRTYGYVFQSGSACMQADGRCPSNRAHLRRRAVTT